MIRNIRQLDLVMVLLSHENADDVERLLRVIERTNFVALKEKWYHRGEGRSLANGRRRRGAEYLF